MTKRRYLEVGEAIEKKLTEDGYEIGQKIPAERELCTEFDVSRSTLREAIVMLELKGVVEVKKGVGIFFVCKENKFTSEDEQMSEIGTFELLEARECVEMQSIILAAKRITPGEIKELWNIVFMQEAEVGKDSERFNALDNEFHKLIAQTTRNRMIITMTDQLWSSVRNKNPEWIALNQSHLHNIPNQKQWISDHKTIITALQKRSPDEAKAALKAHLNHSRRELFVGSDVSSPEFDGYFFNDFESEDAG